MLQTHRHDAALLGVALLAIGTGSIGAGSALPAHLLCAILTWAAALACLTAARVGRLRPR